jgi:hypothetical protein
MSLIAITDDELLDKTQREIRNECIAERTAPSEMFAIVLKRAAEERIRRRFLEGYVVRLGGRLDGA